MAELIFPLQFKRQYSDSLDPDSVFDTASALTTYLTNPLRYAGQIVACTETESRIYTLNAARSAWIEIGGLGYVPENVSNKENATIDTSTIKYPTVNLLRYGLSLKQDITTGLTSILVASSTGTAGFLKKTATDTWTIDTATYLTGNQSISLSGEATGTGATSISVTLDNSAVIGKYLTGLNTVGGGSISSSDSILSAFGKVQNQLTALLGGVSFQGTWNANTNSPTLASGVGTKGYYYIVSASGVTNLDGIFDWKISDWVIFDGASWRKVDNTDAVASVNGFMGAVSLTTDNIPEGVNKYFSTSLARGVFSSGTGINYVSSTGVINCTITQYTDTSARSAISLTTTGNSGASTYNTSSGALNVPNYTLVGLGGEVAGTAAGIMSSHTSTYNHANIANGQTAYGWGNHAGLYLLLTGGNVSGPVSITTGNMTSLNITSGGGVAVSAYSMGVDSYGVAGMSDNIPLIGINLNLNTTGVKRTIIIDSDHAHILGVTAGYGLSIEWRMPYLGTSGLGINSGNIANMLSDVTLGAESSKYSFSLRSAGSIIERMTLAHNGDLWTAGSGTFAGGGFNSLRLMKNLNDDWNGSASDAISQFKLRDFYYKSRPTTDRTLGFIIDEVPESVREYFLMGENNDAINQYTMMGMSFKAHQEEKIEINALKLRIIALEAIINK